MIYYFDYKGNMSRGYRRGEKEASSMVFEPFPTVKPLPWDWFPSWDLVIEESARQLQESESRAAKLRVCLDYFQKRKDSGDQFPGIEILREKGLLSATQN